MEADKTNPDTQADDTATSKSSSSPDAVDDGAKTPREINGPKGPEPTRYGDWEQKGRCSDF
ncbi:MAG: succinate dehydrogenase assembly factor 4 [Alphaproteobacteria bacterium]|jgi:hypothetical protein